MKKFLLMLCLSVLYLNVSFAQVKLGITAGLNGSNTSATLGNSEKTPNNIKAGFQVGAVMDYSITNHFSIVPELLFSQRGSKGNVSSLTLNYLQLPINGAYKFDVGNGNFLIFGGMYVGYSLYGKLKTAGGSAIDVKFGSNENEYKPFDLGINAGAGYQYKKLLARLQFNPGLYNLSNIKNTSFKNTNIAVSVAYFFIQ